MDRLLDGLITVVIIQFIAKKKPSNLLTNSNERFVLRVFKNQTTRKIEKRRRKKTEKKNNQEEIPSLVYIFFFSSKIF